MTSLHVIFGLGPPINNPGYSYARVEGGGISDCAPTSHCLCPPSDSSLNFSTSTRGPANFCLKTGHHKRFSMRHQDRSSERDQVAKDFKMKTFFIFFGLLFQI